MSNDVFKSYSNAQLAALYLCLFSQAQVEAIISGITSDAAGVRYNYQQIRGSKTAPTAVFAFVGHDRNDEADILDLIRGFSLMMYASLKQSWGRAEYTKLFMSLFGVTEAVAVDYAKKVSTDDHEATMSYITRMAKKVGDLILGPLWDPNTTPPNPDIAYEVMLLGREGAELAKRVTSIGAFLEDVTANTLGIRTKTNTGLSPAGDITYLPDESGDVEIEINPEALGDYLAAFGDSLAPDLLRPDEMGAAKKKGGFKRFIGKMKNIVKKIAKSPLLKNALKMIPGVGNVVSAIDTAASAVKTLAGEAGDVIIVDRDRMLTDAPSAVSREVRLGDAEQEPEVASSHYEMGGVVIPSQPILNRNLYGPSGPDVIRMGQ